MGREIELDEDLKEFLRRYKNISLQLQALKAKVTSLKHDEKFKSLRRKDKIAIREAIGEKFAIVNTSILRIKEEGFVKGYVKCNGTLRKQVKDYLSLEL